MKHYAQVASRSLGWNLPYTALIPMVDNFNHSDVFSQKDIITKSMHKAMNKKSDYYNRSKFIANCDKVFAEDEDSNCKFNKENFEANQNELNPQNALKQLSEGVNVWDIPFHHEPYHEIKTDDEDSDSEVDKRKPKSWYSKADIDNSKDFRDLVKIELSSQEKH